jgi:predicted transcriptional regulator of viral defense system
VKDGKATKKQRDTRSWGGLFRVKEAEATGIPRWRLQQLAKTGRIERIARGLYRWRSSRPDQSFTLAAAAKAVPDGIICLLSALRHYDIGTQLPREVWLAVNTKAWRPRVTGLPIRIVRFSGPMLRYGVVETKLGEVRARITSPARTVVDCFRYRRKIGLDVALEALREVLRTRKATRDEILRAAEVCRAKSVIQPYLQALST